MSRLRADSAKKKSERTWRSSAGVVILASCQVFASCSLFLDTDLSDQIDDESRDIGMESGFDDESRDIGMEFGFDDEDGDIGMESVCAEDQVCGFINDALDLPGCISDRGIAAGAICSATASCEDAQVCAWLTDGEGYCVPGCSVVDDRPACVPGCFNQACPGSYEMCLRSTGQCNAVPCDGNDDCAGLVDCDYPGSTTRGFECDTVAGFCIRQL